MLQTLSPSLMHQGGGIEGGGLELRQILTYLKILFWTGVTKGISSKDLEFEEVYTNYSEHFYRDLLLFQTVAFYFFTQAFPRFSDDFGEFANIAGVGFQVAGQVKSLKIIQ